MDIIHPQRIEDFILKFLIDGPQSAVMLLSRIRSEKTKLTKQGFYSALRKLKSEDVILIYKGNVSLNTTWINRMKSVFETIGKAYTTGEKTFDVLGLEEKESISYTFSNIRSLDNFWGHSHNILIQAVPNTEPLYFYDPHYWFYIARKEIEEGLLQEVVESKRQVLMTVGYQTQLDTLARKYFKGDFLQYSVKKMFEDDYYVTIIGDYIIEVTFDEGTVKKIDAVYQNAKMVDENSVKALREVLEARVKNKIKISRNRARAEKLKIKLGKDFYILKDR